MVGPAQQKILGACVLGVALVAAAYTLTNFGQGKALPATVGAAAAPARVAIKVEDKDENGIEDWRDTFLTAKPVIASTISDEYSIPTTTTAKVGIALIEEAIRAKSNGPFGNSTSQIVDSTIADIAQQDATSLFDRSDITIMQTWTDADIKMYSNAMAQILLNGKNSSGKHELVLLKEAVTTRSTETYAAIQKIAIVYKMYRDETKSLPVPAPLAKDHLDLVNTYEALYRDIDAMSKVESDPLLSLTRLKRYTDDAAGLSLALRNFSVSLGTYGHIFSASDPAIIFGMFDPSYKKPQ